MEPHGQLKEKPGIRVVFPVDQVSRLDFDKAYQENRDYILQQAMLAKEKKTAGREKSIDKEHEYLMQI